MNKTLYIGDPVRLNFTDIEAGDVIAIDVKIYRGDEVHLRSATYEAVEPLRLRKATKQMNKENES